MRVEIPGADLRDASRPGAPSPWLSSRWNGLGIPSVGPALTAKPVKLASKGRRKGKPLLRSLGHKWGMSVRAWLRGYHSLSQKLWIALQ